MSDTINNANIVNEKRIMIDGLHYLQVGALVYKQRKGQLLFLLITSRSTKRWIIPKGWPIPGLRLAQSALREAFEEAGIRGVAEIDAIGSYKYIKYDMPNGEVGNFSVDVFAVLYSHQEKKWPERGQRIYEWVTAEVAAERVIEPELKKIFLNYRIN